MNLHRICRLGSVAVLALAVLMLPACGEDTDSDTGPPSAQALADVLMVPEDFGSGWTMLSFPDPEGAEFTGVVTDSMRDMLPRMEFCDKASADSVAAVADLEWEAFRQLNYETGAEDVTPAPGERPKHHLVFAQEFLMSDSESDIEARFDALAAGIRDCWGVETESPDGEVGISEAFDPPAVGDDRIGSLDIVREPGPAAESAVWELYNVLVRDGEVLSALTIVEITSPGVEKMLDDAALAEMITTITDKLS
jgi:hypothetical protein